MQDIACRKCGEPWDIDTLHEVAQDADMDFSEIYESFWRSGCKSLGGRCNEPSTEVDARFGLTRQDAASALYDLLGDDVDGIASELEDLFG